MQEVRQERALECYMGTANYGTENIETVGA